MDESSETVFMLYRASAADMIRKMYPEPATGRDGYHFERASDETAVVPSDGFDEGCVEDTPIVKFGEWYFMTCASHPYPAGQYRPKTQHEQW